MASTQNLKDVRDIGSAGDQHQICLEAQPHQSATFSLLDKNPCRMGRKPRQTNVAECKGLEGMEGLGSTSAVHKSIEPTNNGSSPGAPEHVRNTAESSSKAGNVIDDEIGASIFDEKIRLN